VQYITTIPDGSVLTQYITPSSGPVNSNLEASKLSVGAVVGLVVGIALMLLALLLLLLYLRRRRRHNHVILPEHNQPPSRCKSSLPNDALYLT